MGLKKFITNVKAFLALDEFNNLSKKKSVHELLEKLHKRKKEIHLSLEKALEKKEKNRLEEELAILLVHIKHGKKILDKLNK